MSILFCFVELQLALVLQTGERSFESRNIDRLSSKDRSTCFEVRASYELLKARGLDSHVYTVSPFTLQVLRHDLGYKNGSECFRFHTSTKKVTLPLTSIPPTYENKYVPGNSFVLPSGRLFHSFGRYYFVFFDGIKCSLYAHDGTKRVFLLKNTKDDNDERALKELFKTSFAPDDVYWSYCLVRHSQFFGMPSLDQSIQDTTDTKRLFDYWQKLQTSQQ